MSGDLVGAVARDESTAEFFDAAAEGRFLISRCVPAGHANKPQAHLCSECGSQDLRIEPASGRARLVSWVVVPDLDVKEYSDLGMVEEAAKRLG